MKKLVRPVRKVNPEVVGLDVHQELIVFTRLDRHGNDFEQGSLASTEDALTGFVDRLPGVGRILSAVIAAELGPIQRFTSPKAMGRYTGLTPADRSSAGKQRERVSQFSGGS